MERDTIKIHQLKLNQIWFDYIKQGKKIYEGRLYNDKSKTYKIGDQIEFLRRKSNDIPREIPYETIIKTITNIFYFSSFEDALKNLPLQQVLPNIDTIQEGCNIYYQWHTKEQEQKYGIVMIQLM